MNKLHHKKVVSRWSADHLPSTYSPPKILQRFFMVQLVQYYWKLNQKANPEYKVQVLDIYFPCLPICYRSHATAIIFRYKGVWLWKCMRLAISFQNLLREVLVNERCFKGQVGWRVNPCSLVKCHIISCLTDSKQVWNK